MAELDPDDAAESKELRERVAALCERLGLALSAGPLEEQVGLWALIGIRLASKQPEFCAKFRAKRRRGRPKGSGRRPDDLIVVRAIEETMRVHDAAFPIVLQRAIRLFENKGWMDVPQNPTTNPKRIRRRYRELQAETRRQLVEALLRT
jgi:hypothetical protein